MRTFLKCGKMVKIVCLRTSIVVTERKEKRKERKKEELFEKSSGRETKRERERERETFFVRRVRGDTRVMMMMMRLLYMNELTYGMQTGHFKRASTDHLQVAKVRS